MNSAKKIVKNQGLSGDKSGKKQGLSKSQKNKILVLLGVLAIAVLCGGIMFIQLRPRPILTIEYQDEKTGQTVVSTVNYKDVAYDILNAEMIYNMYGLNWLEEDEEGNTGSDNVKNEIMTTIKDREMKYILATKAGITLTAEEQKELEESVTSARDSFTSEQKKIAGLDADSIRTIKEKEMLADKLKETYLEKNPVDAESIKATVKKEDYKEYSVQYYTIAKTDAEGKEKAADVLKTDKENMDKLYEKAKAAADFSKDMITDSDDDKADDTTGIAFKEAKLCETNGTVIFGEETMKKVKKMKNGDITAVLEDDSVNGYVIIKMVDNNSTSAYETACEDAVASAEDSKYEEYCTNATSTFISKVQTYWKKRVTLGSTIYNPEDAASQTTTEQ